MSFNITVEGGKSVRLPTAGKYCDRDIVIAAEGGGGGGVNMNNCTVVTDPPSKTNYYICRETVNSSGGIANNISKHYTDANITTNVRCDSTMYIVAATIKGATVTDGEVLRVVSGQGLVYKTPSTAGASAQITLSN